jgi:hypothetical protein
VGELRAAHQDARQELADLRPSFAVESSDAALLERVQAQSQREGEPVLSLLARELRKAQAAATQAEELAGHREAALASLRQHVTSLQTTLDRVQNESADRSGTSERLAAQVTMLNQRLEAAIKDTANQRQVIERLRKAAAEARDSDALALMREMRPEPRGAAKASAPDAPPVRAINKVDPSGQREREDLEVPTFLRGARNAEDYVPPLPGATIDLSLTNGVVMAKFPGLTRDVAGKLFAAGIRTVDDLRSASPERLRDMVKAPFFKRPDYEGWIRQARVMSDDRLGG